MNEEKNGAKIFSHNTDIVISVLGYFTLNHPVHQHVYSAFYAPPSIQLCLRA